MSTVIPAAPVAAQLPLPAASGFARLVSLAEGIVFWGILAFGVTFPFLGAAYAWLRS